MKRKSSYAKYGYIFSIPFFIAWLVFMLYPICYTLLIGFTDLKGVGNTNFNILWDDLFKNYKFVLSTPSFKTALVNTVIIWLCNFVPQIILALLLTAWFTDKRCTIKGQGFFKVIFYMPNIITAATVAILFNQFFAYPKGVVNDILVGLGIFKDNVNMLNNGTVARGIIVFIQTWMWYGYTSIVMISGVLGISPELFEAAEVDGANRWQTFFRITIPCIKTVLLFTLVTSMIGGLQMFDIPKLFLDGGPDNATITTSVFIYNQAFAGSYFYNRASAASVIMFIIISILSIIMFYMLRDKDEVALRKLIRQQEKAYKRKQKGL